MKNLMRIKPSNITDELFQKIIGLHQQHFGLPAEVIKNLILQRDYLHIYFEPNGKEIIATIGVQWYLLGEDVLLYIGNAVVRKDCQQRGLLTQSIYSSIITTLYRYPGKNKYCLALATTPKAYAYFGKLKDYWPQHNGSINIEANYLIDSFLKNYYPNQFCCKEGSYFVKKTEVKSVAREQSSDKDLTHHEKWFIEHNPLYREGQQLVCLAKMNFSNVAVIVRMIINNLKKSIIKSYRNFLVKHSKLIAMIEIIGISLVFAFTLIAIVNDGTDG